MRQQVTRNDSDEAERRERSPSGVVSAANDEELAAAGGQVGGEAAPRMGVLRKSAEVPRRAGRSGRAIVHAAGGQALKKALRSHPQTTGTQFVAGNGMERQMKLMYYYMSMSDWKAEMNLRTPKLTSDGIGPDR